MMDWHKLTGMATRAADRAFGEPVRLSFLVGGAVDPERPALDTRAQLHLPGEAEISLGRGNSALSAAIVAGAGLVILQRSAGAPELRQGDKVRADARPGQPWFEVTDVDDRAASQIVATII
jgi:hypothetical protein